MSDKKFTVLIDMDDTIEHLTEAWLKWLNDRYGTNVTEDDIHDYDISKAFPMLEPSEVYEPLFHIGLWCSVKPMKGARYAIERLQNEGYEVYIITSSNFQTIDAKLKYVLFKYFPTIDPDHVIVAKKKQMLRCDVMIDDAPHNLIDGDYIRIMPNASHNRDFDAEAYDIERADNWDEIYDLVTEYWKIYQGTMKK